MEQSYPNTHYISIYLRDTRLATLGYFDGVNFAGGIRWPMAVGIPMEDTVCPPQTQY